MNDSFGWVPDRRWEVPQWVPAEQLAARLGVARRSMNAVLEADVVSHILADLAPSYPLVVRAGKLGKSLFAHPQVGDVLASVPMRVLDERWVVLHRLKPASKHPDGWHGRMPLSQQRHVTTTNLLLRAEQWIGDPFVAHVAGWVVDCGRIVAVHQHGTHADVELNRADPAVLEEWSGVRIFPPPLGASVQPVRKKLARWDDEDDEDDEPFGAHIGRPWEDYDDEPDEL